MFKRSIVIASLILSLCAVGCGTAKASAQQISANGAAQAEKAVAPPDETRPGPATSTGDTVATDTPSSSGLLTIDVDDLLENAGTPILGYKDNVSSNTVLVSADKEIVTAEVINALCDKYGLYVLYDYENFAMYALSTVNTLSEDDFNEMISNLSKEEGILSVEKDQMLGLDSVVSPVLRDGLSIQ